MRSIRAPMLIVTVVFGLTLGCKVRNLKTETKADAAASQEIDLAKSLGNLVSSASLGAMCEDKGASAKEFASRFGKEISSVGNRTSAAAYNADARRRASGEARITDATPLNLFLEDSRHKLRARVAKVFLNESLRIERSMFPFAPNNWEGKRALKNEVSIPSSCLGDQSPLSGDEGMASKWKAQISKFAASSDELRRSLAESADIWRDAWFRQMISAVIEIKYIEHVFLSRNAASGRNRWSTLVGWDAPVGEAQLGIFRGSDGNNIVSPAARVNDLMATFPLLGWVPASEAMHGRNGRRLVDVLFEILKSDKVIQALSERNALPKGHKWLDFESHYKTFYADQQALLSKANPTSQIKTSQIKTSQIKTSQIRTEIAGKEVIFKDLTVKEKQRLTGLKKHFNRFKRKNFGWGAKMTRDGDIEVEKKVSASDQFLLYNLFLYYSGDAFTAYIVGQSSALLDASPEDFGGKFGEPVTSARNPAVVGAYNNYYKAIIDSLHEPIGEYYQEWYATTTNARNKACTMPTQHYEALPELAFGYFLRNSPKSDPDYERLQTYYCSDYSKGDLGKFHNAQWGNTKAKRANQEIFLGTMGIFAVGVAIPLLAVGPAAIAAATPVAKAALSTGTMIGNIAAVTFGVANVDASVKKISQLGLARSIGTISAESYAQDYQGAIFNTTIGNMLAFFGFPERLVVLRNQASRLYPTDK